MKKILSFAFALAAVSFAVSCNKETAATVETETVTFSIELPGAIQSKAIADGTKAVKLLYATYTEGGKLLESLSMTDINKAEEIKVDIADGKKKATVDLRLVKDIKYDVVFWAQSENCTAFEFDWKTAKTMTVSYEGAANDDLRDAFYAVVNNVVFYNNVDYPMGDIEGVSQNCSTVSLKRPFAQINFGASDYDSVTEYYTPESIAEKMTSAFACQSTTNTPNFPNTLNLLTSEVTGSAPANFKAAQIPSETTVLKVGGVEYRWVAMNYILAPKKDESTALYTVTGTFTYKDDDTATEPDINRIITVTNVPISKNYRTNILGNFFTVETPFTVIVEEAFEGDLPEITVPQQ